MRWSRSLIPTLKENPKEAETPSHRLLLRGGFITQHQSGVYTFLPLGWRVMLKIQNIIREEMDAIGAQELLMPALTTGDVWKLSGRWESFGKDMFKLKDRKGKDIALAPTHEEIISLLAKDYIRSYRDLPQIWYQLQTKFRDEPRPRGGILRVREFIMKDSYSFDKDWKGLEISYQKHKEAYSKIFQRCGLKFVVVEASSGLMGGKKSEEFMVITETGEDAIAVCESCGYHANVEVAKAKLPVNRKTGPFNATEIVHTPNVKSVEEVSSFLGIEPSLIVKSILFSNSEGKLILVLIRGDYEINESKLKQVLGDDFGLASPEYVAQKFGVEVGFVGPIGIEVDKIIADESIKFIDNFVVGANKSDHHMVGVKVSDLRIDEFVDVRTVRDGDLCERCNAPLKVKNALEVGHIFQLGTRYSDSLDVKYTDTDGTLKPIVMGSYGIGVGRIMAAAVELYHDEKGIIWPFSIAPYHVNIVEINSNKTAETTEKIYSELKSANFETLWDDRNVSAGVKFKDAELIGIPINIVISENNLKRGEVEIQLRKDGSKYNIKLEVLRENLENVVRDKGL
uniref:Proline--tRNA ligase n=1 Tax=candidate division WOR-3 bacterium TaxID=2052148 RepID=A0A7V3ZYW9_UNCW3